MHFKMFIGIKSHPKPLILDFLELFREHWRNHYDQLIISRTVTQTVFLPIVFTSIFMSWNSIFCPYSSREGAVFISYTVRPFSQIVVGRREGGLTMICLVLLFKEKEWTNSYKHKKITDYFKYICKYKIAKLWNWTWQSMIFLWLLKIPHFSSYERKAECA